MSKPYAAYLAAYFPACLPAYLGIFLASWIVMGCGNKGDLFLPTDPGLARELEEASQRTNDIAEDLTEEALEKKKRQAVEPPQ